MSRHLGHLPEDAIVQRGLANLGNKVLLDHSDRRNHLSSLFLKSLVAVPQNVRRSDRQGLSTRSRYALD
jgi:hypothetical protein